MNGRCNDAGNEASNAAEWQVLKSAGVRTLFNLRSL